MAAMERLPDEGPERTDPASLGARLRLALDLVEVGVELMRQNLRRQHPGANDDEIQALLNAWLAELPEPAGPGMVVREGPAPP